MPTRKPTAPVTSSVAITPKPKKKSAPPPPPPHEKDHHEKPHKPGKKQAHKHADKHADKPRGKHLRRVYEHLGRVEALQGLAEVEAVPSLIRLAQAGIDRDQARSAADLLRAAEHLSFAAVAAQSGSGPALSPDLEEAIRREFRKLLETAEEHDLTHGSTLDDLLRQTLLDARSAFDAGSFRQALELARAAESLAEIDPDSEKQLDPPQSKRALKS